jgi:ElaB/YqjD/DUF883 family membrane-anchored ribosome-binding protein
MHPLDEVAPVTGKLETHFKDPIDNALEANETRGGANSTMASAKDAVAEAGATAVETLKSALMSTDTYVRENPWIAIAVTGVIGIALGYVAAALSAPRPRRWSKI